MSDSSKPRHEVKLWAKTDDEQAEFQRFCEALARDGYTDEDGNPVAPDADKAEACAARAETFEESAAFWHEHAPDVPRDVETPI